MIFLRFWDLWVQKLLVERLWHWHLVDWGCLRTKRVEKEWTKGWFKRLAMKVTYGVYGWEKLKTMIKITTSGNPNSILKKNFQIIIYAFFCGKKMGLWASCPALKKAFLRTHFLVFTPFAYLSDDLVSKNDTQPIWGQEKGEI